MTVEQLVGLLRGEHRGRLVEDEQVDVAGERLDDLDPLLDADRQVLDHRVRVDRQAVPLGDLERPRGGRAGGPGSRAVPPRTCSAPSMMFSATVKTGTSMKCWCTMPMPAAMASPGPLDLQRLAVDQDLALVRLEQPVEHVHQGGLAGAVLAEQGVDLARLDRQVDVVVGDQVTEALGDAAQFESQRNLLECERWCSVAAGRRRPSGAGDRCAIGRSDAARSPATPDGRSSYLVAGRRCR